MVARGSKDETRKSKFACAKVGTGEEQESPTGTNTPLQAMVVTSREKLRQHLSA